VFFGVNTCPQNPSPPPSRPMSLAYAVPTVSDSVTPSA
jgi:hypothetical protein